MAERNTAEELDDVYEIKYSTDAMTGGAFYFGWPHHAR